MDNTLPAAGARRSDNGVKYKGVRLRKWGRYVSEIRYPNSRERIWLGSYGTAEEAARAFDAAQLCLRGAGANFNFPHDLPDMPGGQALTPPEIQAIAQNYARRFGSEGSSSNNQQPREAETESAATATATEWMDWTILDELGSEHGERNYSGRVSDFEFSQEPGDDMYAPLHFGDTGNDGRGGDNRGDDVDYDNGNGSNAQSFWNF